MPRITVLSPVSERAGFDIEIPMNPRPKLNRGLRIGLLSNGKPKVPEFFEGIVSVMSGRVDVAPIVLDKGNTALPAPLEMLAQLAANCDLVVTAMAD